MKIRERLERLEMGLKIAQELGVPVKIITSIKTRMKAEGIRVNRKGPLSGEFGEEVREAISQREPLKSIAKRLRVDFDFLAALRREMISSGDLNMRPSLDLPREIKEEVREALKRYDSQTEIAKRFGVPPKNVIRLKEAMFRSGEITKEESQAAVEKQIEALTLKSSVDGWQDRLKAIKLQKIKEGKQARGLSYDYT
jgi:transposase-like protein